jgi:hypothetical protein
MTFVFDVHGHETSVSMHQEVQAAPMHGARLDLPASARALIHSLCASDYDDRLDYCGESVEIAHAHCALRRYAWRERSAASSWLVQPRCAWEHCRYTRNRNQPPSRADVTAIAVVAPPAR